MATQRRSSRRSRPYMRDLVVIRISDHDNPQTYRQLELTGLHDRDILARAISEYVRSRPRSLIVISIAGHQPWLAEVLSSVLDNDCNQISDLNREVLFSSTAKFPERASRHGKSSAWLFIIDQMNVPEVYYWSLGLTTPRPDDYGFLDISKAKLRTGVWICASDACKFDLRIPVVIICTRPERVSELVVCDVLFNFLHNSRAVSQPLADDDWICWIFSRLHWLLTDWQNIIREVHGRLEAAELNSYHRRFPVKYRTRTMHREIAHIHELTENLRFHTRCFRRLQRLKSDTVESQKTELWQDIDDAIEDLEQHLETLNSLKERLDNLLGLEFNIQAADQSEGSTFLSVIATLFLPVSFLTGLWGITSSTWSVLWYICAAVPIFTASAAFLIFYPMTLARWQKTHYRLDQTKILLRRRDYTMLGAELPDDVDALNNQAWGRARHRSQQIGDSGPPKRRSSDRRGSDYRHVEEKDGK